MKTQNRQFSFVFGALFLSSIVALTACGADVVGGGGGGSGGMGTTSTASTGGNGGGNGGGGVAGGNPGGPNAIAMLYSELSSGPNPAGTTTAAGGGPDPNTLYIAISNTPEICADPFVAEECGEHFRVSFGIPVALQKVGVIQLNDPTIIANSSYSGMADASGQCPFGGGSFWDGTLEITAIDGNHVAGILSNTSTFDFDANGPFDAARCAF
jgi:hypothetical protein